MPPPSIRRIFALIFSISIVFACKNEPSGKIVTVSATQKFILLDQTAAQTAITTDTCDGFFARITTAEMSYQLQKNKIGAPAGRPQLLAAYQNLLRSDVADFTADEQRFLNDILKETYEYATKMSPTFFPEKVLLAKIQGKTYGDDVFFTRQNTIFIPQSALNQRNNDEMLKTLLHELSHIYTRTHLQKKYQLYAQIGFRPVRDGKLLIGDTLAERLITNPDGTDLGWTTTLVTNEGNVEAMPLMYLAPDRAGNPNMPWFFFEYFEVEKTPQGTNIITVGGSRSTIRTKDIVPIFQQKYNTDYIIHPDEIIASNVAILAYSYKKNNVLTPLTDAGRDFLAKMHDILNQ
ncbi:MAG: hypothetical protein RL757_2046 [Bacteroidota bacterium]|jgi:hypothetical protein